MAIHSQNLWPLLKALGAPEYTRDFKLHAPLDDAVTVEVTCLPSIDVQPNSYLAELVKRFYLVEIPASETVAKRQNASPAYYCLGCSRLMEIRYPVSDGPDRCPCCLDGILRRVR